jgi:alkylation response protein AidB-like acyl-CoA dehydrogenase
MDARLTDEQEMVQESAREFIEANGGIDYARREMNGDESVINEVWDEMDSMGYTTLTVPVSHGGMGEGMVYLSALLEELDRFALPGPYPETVAFSVPLIDELGTSEQKTELFDAVVEQGHKMTFALHDSRNQRVPNAIEMGAARVEEGFVLTGTKTLVPYGSSVDSVVVAARTRDASDYHGISLFVVDTDKVDYTRLDSLDQTRPMYDLEFDEVVIPEDSLLGPLHGGGSALSRSFDLFNL